MTRAYVSLKVSNQSKKFLNALLTLNFSKPNPRASN